MCPKGDVAVETLVDHLLEQSIQKYDGRDVVHEEQPCICPRLIHFGPEQHLRLERSSAVLFFMHIGGVQFGWESSLDVLQHCSLQALEGCYCH